MKELPDSWLPDLPASYANNPPKIILHWTAGRHHSSMNELDHYHLLVEGDGNYIKGLRPIGTPAPHTWGYNWEIGVSLCCMAAAQSNFHHGMYPMTEIQWNNAVKLIAKLVQRYNISVIKENVLTHAEVTKVLGKDQWGKWDITELSFDHSVRNPGDLLRSSVIETIRGSDVMERGVWVSLSDSVIEKLAGRLTNGTTYIKARDLDKKVYHIHKASGTTMKVLRWPLPPENTGAVEPVFSIDMVNIDGSGYIAVRELEKLGYVVAYESDYKRIVVTPKNHTKK